MTKEEAAAPLQAPPLPPPLTPEIEEAHAMALKEKLDTYTDPLTGYMVMTSLYHQ
jgi:hypothetical protein